MTRRLHLALVLACLAVLAPAPQAAWSWTAANLRTVAEQEDRFFTYDFESTWAARTNCDWPVTIVFWGQATVDKVKKALSSSLWLPGNEMYAYVSEQRIRKHPYRWAADRGVKSLSFTRALHVRLYADADGCLTNGVWGDYVLATTHYDLNELSADPTFGRSEEAAAAVEALCATAWGADAVEADVLSLFNEEPDRVEQRPNDKGGVESHFWQCDGLATMVYVP